jgi:hypothetical protein
LKLPHTKKTQPTTATPKKKLAGLANWALAKYLAGLAK